MAIYCEEFHTRPIVAVRDLYHWKGRDEPNGLSLRVIETRQYMRAYEQLREAEEDPEHAEYDENNPMLDLVREISAEASYEADADNIEEVRQAQRALRAAQQASQQRE